jgi:hypothetical protein
MGENWSPPEGCRTATLPSGEGLVIVILCRPLMRSAASLRGWVCPEKAAWLLIGGRITSAIDLHTGAALSIGNLLHGSVFPPNDRLG